MNPLPIITRSIICNNGFIITYYRPGQLGDADASGTGWAKARALLIGVDAQQRHPSLPTGVGVPPPRTATRQAALATARSIGLRRAGRRARRARQAPQDGRTLLPSPQHVPHNLAEGSVIAHSLAREPKQSMVEMLMPHHERLSVVFASVAADTPGTPGPPCTCSDAGAGSPASAACCCCCCAAAGPPLPPPATAPTAQPQQRGCQYRRRLLHCLWSRRHRLIVAPAASAGRPPPLPPPLPPAHMLLICFSCLLIFLSRSLICVF